MSGKKALRQGEGLFAGGDYAPGNDTAAFAVTVVHLKEVSGFQTGSGGSG